MSTGWPDTPDAVPVRIETLGRFAVTVEGAPVEGGSRLPHKVLALLKALVALGGQQVSADTLTEALWPDADADQAYRTFSVTLSRLRRLIGGERLRLRGGRLSLDERACWVDAWSAESELKAARQAAQQGVLDAASQHLANALALYRGPFLEGEFDPPPILSARERLHGLLLRAIRDLGEACEAQGRHQAALDLYERGLAIDELSEELYQHALRCLLACRRRAEGLLLYERCRRLLHGSLGIEPSPQTVALAEALRKADPPEDSLGRSPPPTVVPVPAPETTVAAPLTPAVVEAAPWLERRPVAVLFFAPGLGFNAGSDPEAEALLAQAAHDTVAQVVERHGGVLNQQVADVFVAVFGLPEAHEDDTRRAVDAALELHGHLAAQLAEQPGDTPPVLSPRAAVSAGLVVTGEPNPRTGMYALHGDKLLLAQRLLLLAGEGEVILGPESHRAVAQYFHTVPLPTQQLPGFGIPVTPHRVVAPTGVRTRFEAAQQRGLAPLVGRKAELALLAQAWQAAQQGHGRFVALSAEAGLGKSRILHEFVRTIDARSAMVVWGTCDARRQDTPYHPFVSALQGNLLQERARTREEQAALLVRRVRLMSPDLMPTVPYLLHLLSLQHPEHPLPPEAAGELLRDRLEAALGALITVAAQRQPVVVALEDWHWADEASDTALRTLAGALAHKPMLLVVSHRPEDVRPWQTDAHALHLTLQAFGPEEAHDLMAAVLGVDEVPLALRERLYQLTEGNPFFIEELCPSLLERGAVSVRGGHLRVAEPVDEVPIPDSLRAVVRSRLDHLRSEERLLLQVASVIGQQVPERVLLSVMDTLGLVVTVLEQLKQLGFLQQAQVFPEPVLRFHHAVSHTVVYESMLSAQRRQYHLRIAQAIEALAAGAGDEHVEELALHYHGAGMPARESQYAEAAGDKAARMVSLAAARRHYNAALTSQTLADGEVDRARRIDLTLKLASVSFYDPGDGLTDMLATALEDARGLGDAERELRTTFASAFSHYARGDVVLARQLFQRCETMPVLHRLPGIAVLAENYLGRLCLYLGEFDEALRRLEEATEPLTNRRNPAELANTLGSRILVYIFQGEFAAASPLLAELHNLAREAASPTIEALAEICGAGIALMQGTWAVARERACAAARLARQVGNPVMEGMAGWVEGHATVRLGDLREGMLGMHRSIRRMEHSGSYLGLGFYGAVLAEFCAVAGRPRLAARYLRKVERMEAAGGDRVGAPTAERTRALLALPDTALAARHAAQSLRIARKRGQRPDEARALLLQADIHRVAGHHAEACRAAKSAAQAFRRLGMTWWEQQTEASGKAHDTDPR